jgi:hypothetical protein
LTLSVLLLCSGLWNLTALAGEKPAITLTGHAHVDFFGTTLTLQRDHWSPAQPPAMFDQETPPDEEKSPWLAGALSLAIPGTGEIYSNSYLKAGAFMAFEAASWLIAYTYNKKGDRQTGDFQNFADQHYSAWWYAKWTHDNVGALTNGAHSSGEYDGVFRDGTDSPSCNAPFACVNWIELNRMERDISGVLSPPTGYTHQMPYFGEQQYYELIGKYDQFSRGWDDADLRALAQGDLPIKSNSQEFYAYAKMRAQANNYYDVASTWVSVVVINHVVSALDAFWSATRFNKSLHAGLKMRVQPTPFGVVPVTEAKIEYTF